MRIRLLLLSSMLSLTACCNALGCSSGFGWQAPVPAGWTAEEIEAARVRLCLNGACEERPFSSELPSVGEVEHGSDGSLSIRVSWTVWDDIPQADGDLVSLTLLAEDGTPIMGIAETAVTYEVTVLNCDYGTCFRAGFEGSTL